MTPLRSSLPSLSHVDTSTITTSTTMLATAQTTIHTFPEFQPHFRTSIKHISLQDALPRDFSDMYAPEVVNDPSVLLASGRPIFTQRELIDWTKNDIRSLLIVCTKPDHGLLPISTPGFRYMYLPLDSTDEEIIATLVQSDLYREHGFDPSFLRQTAQYTVEAARMRADNAKVLTKPQWRNIIENYLLNLGCEAQCRADFKRACHMAKQPKSKLARAPSLEPIDEHKSLSSSLLRQALLNTSPELKAASLKKRKLNKSEKQQIWVKVQTELYSRLGLNWAADDFN
ncbi:YALI0B04796p [Yarrowia lipolytica CLIB122]|uniref:YALI0B04796p n=3 Tax=Yarrowia lipolytica TaxID=4952 RepID=W0TYN7_YARLI|nr:YALI0B04796p [Yarrowia lipolytica CLIB122]AOW01236.1 hypothetical protein YALI1_B06607g [Yarrowia lipolytica]KAJ8052106.1 hypothetical protein LXG23DRAFT_50187 [Yarrowia lipolytica]CAG82735.4 YALI0B04796p [Yarrowia lipolytica CLIB122]|eukprot:XP_002143004.1 YALI0B04796p [Yarrowia lipolytica CLIB122]